MAYEADENGYRVTKMDVEVKIFFLQIYFSLIEKRLYYTRYMYSFFSDELRKFTIRDFPKQTHFGPILITLLFFFTL